MVDYKYLSEVASEYGYTCTHISWEDCSRYGGKGTLSWNGDNITDVFLESREGTKLYTIRSKNWNEMVCKVKSSDIALVNPSGDKNETLSGLLRRMNLSHSNDDEVSLRFQVSFLPYTPNKKTEFCVNAYNYQARAGDPCNLQILASPQTTSLTVDGGGRRLGLQGDVDTREHRPCYWIEASPGDAAVGEPQGENAETVGRAVDSGKATAVIMGIRDMGLVYNAILFIQVPIKQLAKPRTRFHTDETDGIILHSAGGSSFGKSYAARISKGEKLADVPPLPVGMERHDDSHITVTITLYNTVEGGNPVKHDVERAIRQMNALFSNKAVNRDCLSWGEKKTLEDFRDYEKRLASFKGSRFAEFMKEDLAETGFFWVGKEDQTTCWWCNVTVGGWGVNDNPWAEHQKNSPGCAKAYRK